ncbi:hypothetical protein MMC34_006393 [Xylographa carneopallida]|nr:hypothetical protein [Xylographa carneopallida]
MAIRHTDWWDWEHERALHLDPKQKGQAQKLFLGEHQKFSEGSWGESLRHLHGLQQFVLELETVESKRAELDEIIVHAAGWRFPLEDGNVLVLDESRTVHSTWMSIDRFYANTWQGRKLPQWCLENLEPYQTPKLKPTILEMAEDFLADQEASLSEELDSSATDRAERLVSASVQTGKLESPEQAVANPEPVSTSVGSKGMTSEIAHKIIAEVQAIEGFQPEELSCIYGYVQTGLTEEEIAYQAYHEIEDMLALHYIVVKLT